MLTQRRKDKSNTMKGQINSHPCTTLEWKINTISPVSSTTLKGNIYAIIPVINTTLKGKIKKTNPVLNNT